MRRLVLVALIASAALALVFTSGGDRVPPAEASHHPCHPSPVAGAVVGAAAGPFTHTNSTGAPASLLCVTYAGSGGSLNSLTVTANAPGCPAPVTTVAGDNRVFIDWGTACVAAGSAVTINFNSAFPGVTAASVVWGVTKYRALLVAGSPAIDAASPLEVLDVDHLKSALEGNMVGGTNWTGPNAMIEVMYSPTQANLKTKIETFFKDADDDDISLFFISTHGEKEPTDAPPPPPNGDEPVNDTFIPRCDAPLHLKECDESLVGPPYSDDEFDEPFKKTNDNPPKFSGNKVIALEACFSGGMKDGIQDLPVQNSGVLTSATTNQKSWEGDDHFIFPGYLISGLADDGNGFARADTTPQNLKVTTAEWFAYADPKTTALAATIPEVQNPEPAGDLSAVFFTYVKNKLDAHEEPTLTLNGGHAHCEEAPVGVGGTAELLVGGAPSSASGGAGPSVPMAALASGIGAAALLAVVAGGWYARRRWMR